MSEQRSLRVLHVGNVANNAYHNAKLLRAAGFDCDVFCFDYYHVMACPEWEDADFDGDPGDPFRPAWHRVDLHGFARPRWFAQGPFPLAARYLLALRRGERARAALLWRLLEGSRVLGAELAPRLGAEQGALRWERLLPKERPPLGRLLAAGPREALSLAGELALRALGFLVVGIVATALGLARAVQAAFATRGEVAAPDDAPAPAAAGWPEAFRALFPTRADALRPEDLARCLRDAQRLAPLFREYDVVIGYATDAILPLLAGHRPYLAFEHGTLRRIPDEPTERGRTTALAYALADHVFVTNHDCVGVAQRLAPGGFCAVNHRWDVGHALGVAGAPALRETLLRELGGELLLFHPTRHDWVPGKGYADKANDRFLRAFARARREDGLPFALVCCAWGADVAESQALLASLGVERAVRWVPPLGTVGFERTVLASDYVVDQFELGAIGGVAFKALSAGRPLLTHLDEPAILAQFGELPPVENAQSEDEILGALRRIAKTREGWEARCSAARAWIRRHHAADALVRREREIVEQVLASPRPVGPAAARERIGESA